MEVAYSGFLTRFFFQDQIFSEMGFAASMSIFGGNTTLFFRKRDPGSLRLNDGDTQSFPALGCWITSHPSSLTQNKGMNNAYRDGAVMPTTDTYRPIPSQYFEYIHQDEFWDIALKKWGSTSVKPLVSMETNLTSPTLPPKFTAPVAIHEGSKWYEDQGQSSKPTYSVRQLATMSASDRQAATFAEITRKNAERSVRRARFLNGRSNFASSVRQSWKAVTYSWLNESKAEVIVKLRALIDVLRKEARRQWREIAHFIFNKDSDAAHHTYLRELNHYMRHMVRDFDINIVAQSGDQEMIDAAASLTEMADTCLIMLNDRAATSAVTYDDYYLQSKKKVTRL
jgi:hypothetical protein